MSTSSMLDQDPTHGARGNGEKLCAVPAAPKILAGEAKKGFVDQRPGLERMARPFVAQESVRESSELCVHQGYELNECVRIALI